ncbi:unnamed protein product, partial [Ectocarpus sp. 12 AP-2014]
RWSWEKYGEWGAYDWDSSDHYHRSDVWFGAGRHRVLRGWDRRTDGVSSGTFDSVRCCEAGANKSGE